MDNNLKEILWRQFGASIDMLKNAIELCPEAHWDTKNQFWYNAYHSIFFLDYYLTIPPVGFAPPDPFDLSEFEDRMPNSVYSKEELLFYTQFCRNKCHNLIMNMTDELYKSVWENESKTMQYNVIEIILYNLRHVQHHVGQLNMLLRQMIDEAPDWLYETEK